MLFCALYGKNWILILDAVWTFSIYGNMVYSSLPLGLLKAVSSNSISSPQNLLLVQIYYGISNLCQFALWFWSCIFGSFSAILYCNCQEFCQLMLVVKLLGFLEQYFYNLCVCWFLTATLSSTKRIIWLDWFVGCPLKIVKKVSWRVSQ